jgi:hypothetical protein
MKKIISSVPFWLFVLFALIGIEAFASWQNIHAAADAKEVVARRR